MVGVPNFNMKLGDESADEMMIKEGAAFHQVARYITVQTIFRFYNIISPQKPLFTRYFHFVFDQNVGKVDCHQ